MTGEEIIAAEGWLSYAEIADELVEYVKSCGYTHIEFMPLAEHPSDESWGYQITGFFAPTSRYGTPKQLMELVDKAHRAGIGVIMDFVPVHFAVDHYALTEYDGTRLYEFPDDEAAYNEWGSRNFMHSKGEVRSFLQSAADYWLSVYHFDGLRMDAVRNMIYWNGREYLGENRYAIQLLKDMNCGLKAYRNEVVKNIEVYGEMHRYIPYLAKNAGFDKITEKPVHHQKRKYGKSKFGLERFVNGFLDLLSLWFLSTFGKKPMHFFGFSGLLMFLVGFIMTIWIIIAKLVHQAQGIRYRAVTDQPLFYLALVAVMLGVILFLSGFICEMISRTSQDRNKYNVKETID